MLTLQPEAAKPVGRASIGGSKGQSRASELPGDALPLPLEPPEPMSVPSSNNVRWSRNQLDMHLQTVLSGLKVTFLSIWTNAPLSPSQCCQCWPLKLASAAAHVLSPLECLSISIRFDDFNFLQEKSPISQGHAQHK